MCEWPEGADVLWEQSVGSWSKEHKIIKSWSWFAPMDLCCMAYPIPPFLSPCFSASVSTANHLKKDIIKKKKNNKEGEMDTVRLSSCQFVPVSHCVSVAEKNPLPHTKHFLFKRTNHSDLIFQNFLRAFFKCMSLSESGENKPWFQGYEHDSVFKPVFSGVTPRKSW